MIRINLLPVEMTVTERRVDPKYFIGAIGGAALIAMVPFHLFQQSRRSELRKEMATTQAELDHFKPIVAQVEALEEAKRALEQRKGVIQTLETERLRYPYFIEDFLKLLPSNVWLTNLTTTLPPDGASVSISMDIVALDHYAVADMVSNLETSQIFTDVTLGPITLSQSQTGQSIAFNIKTVYRKAAMSDAIKKS